jgi:cytochrome c553
MYHCKSIISACLALMVLFLSTAVLAEDNKPASQQPTASEAAKKESSADTKLRMGRGDPVAGKSKAVPCFGCHGENGNSAVPQFPKLAGQYAIYIEKQLHNYQAGLLNHQVMGSLAASLGDEDIADIGAYYASQPMMKGDRPSNNALGKKLFENDDLPRMMVRCKNCHGPEGKGLYPANPVFPVIGGQHKDFLLGQLTKFRKGARNNSPGGVMNTTVHRLTDAELEALADYISGL